ncbi:D-ribose ABC transporter substrate-binding protein [Flavobacterium palustre]|uniref:D-ribose ABC transporter substrate-binding protein n=1 Tax=Flavobacterium palustre TaxID=1476463 RepID=A0ABQ1HFU9_9FLAO|nr:D-ribose ABC transporter substrate-binding protein [Flavobacterium palustre]GGA73967.1 D-ribose ABC transporter substrate-binding protein [Flavobacterium palustre]
MKIKQLSLLILTVIFVFGCSSKEKSEKPKIAVVVSTLNNPWFVMLAESAAENAKKLGYEAKIFDSQNNPAIESDNFENLISSGYDAILLNPTDSDGSISNILKAKTAGIPVFCMDREVNADDAATSQILSDNYSGCVAIGIEFVKELKEKGKYVEILGLVGDNNTWARSGGFHSVVDKFPNLKMVAQQSGDFDRNKAMEVLETILQANPDIDGVFCGNDAMAMGAFQALQAAGKETKVKIFGFDGASDVVEKIREKKIVATGMQFPKVMAQTAAQYADEYFKGRKVFPQRVPVEVELVNAANIKDY